jgi:heat shock protein HslJ
MLAVVSTLISTLLVAPLFAQTPTAEESATIIPPVVWESVEMTPSNDGQLAIAEPARYTVQFHNKDTVLVRADCNQVAGTYTANDGVLDVSLNVATLALCSSDSHVEPFLDLLDRATDFEIDPDGLLIVSGENGRLRLRPSLVGVVWEWQERRGGDDSLIAPSRPEDYTLTFMPDGKLAILAGCVRILGMYTVDGSIIGLSFDGPIPAGCQPEQLTRRYLRDLGDVSSHVFRDGHLYLALPADAGIMAFEARYAEPTRATPHAGHPTLEPA